MPRMAVTRLRGIVSSMIQATALTKRYGDRVAVDDANFTVEAGRVTGFLGPRAAHRKSPPPTRRII